MADLMPERYGVPSLFRRRVILALVAVVALAALGWLAWAAWLHSNPKIQAEVASFKVSDDHEVRALVDLRLKDPDVTGSCLLRATALDHSIVGERNIRVQRLSAHRSEWVSIRTERRATSVEVQHCTAD